MHIALFSPAWPLGSRPNGIVTYVNWMRRGLIAQGHRVSVFSSDVGPSSVGAGVHYTERSLLTRLASRALGNSVSVFDGGDAIGATVEKIHARDPIDVFEMEESFGWAAGVQKATRVPVVVKLHGPAFLHLVEEDRRTAFGQEKIRREGQALSQMPFVMSPSKYHLSATVQRYDMHPRIAEHIVNPVALDNAAPLWELDRCDRNTLLFVGRFDKVKGGDLIVLALQRLLRKRPELKLIFVGPDPGLVLPDDSRVHLKQFVEMLADSSVGSALVYRGPLAQEEIVALRTVAMCTLVASRCENQPYTALEAMLQGCPVVCTDNTGLSEIVEHGVTGLKARSECAEDLATQVERVLDDPVLAGSLGHAARLHVRAAHSPAKVAQLTLDLYRRSIELRSSDALGHR